MRFLPSALLALPFSLLAADPGPPAAPAGWKIEVVAQVPQILDPTMIAVAPDGRVFIGQQTAAMENYQKKEPLDSIVVLHPDGQVTTFATGLYNVFGLAYLDGKVFVNQWPKVSVFADDNSVGKSPVDLFEVSKERGGYMQHIAGNMRYAMDGYFYMSIGDRGVFGATGTDGSKAELRGGGVLRFRPDGSQLEVFASGTRNSPDLAINAEDEIFTLDNTDDGGGWNVRLTNIVDGGFYGYPWDYKPRRPYTLWCMEDYGGGSPTGAIAYNEDALPDEFRGNLFMSEWGKRSLLRFRPGRDGATFKVPAREELIHAKSGGSECHPIGLAWSPDGMSLYVADWNNGGWRQAKKVGRILKMTFTGAPSVAASKPAWWLPAAMGQPSKATTAELIEGLKHPAQSVRLVAQRRLFDAATDPAKTDLERARLKGGLSAHSGPDMGRGTEEVPSLLKLLNNKTAPAHARWSAIWTLDAIARDHLKASNGRGLAADVMNASVACLQDPEVSVRRQALRQLGSARHLSWLVPVQNLLNDPDASIRFHAATTVGRFGNSASVVWLLKKLDDPDFFARYAVFHALNRIGRSDPSAWPGIAEGLKSDNAAIREGTLFAMRETFVIENAQALAAFVEAPANHAEKRLAALTTIAELHRQPKPWDGKWWNNTPVKDPPPAKTVEWAGTPVVLATVTRALSDDDPRVAAAALAAAPVTRDPAAAPVLAEWFRRATDVPTKQTILRAIGASPGDAGRMLLTSLFANPVNNAPVLTEAIAAAGGLGDGSLLSAVAQIATNTKDAGVAAAAINALRAGKSPEAMPTFVKLLRHADAEVRAAAGDGLARLGGDAVLKAVLPLLDDPDADVRRAAIATLAPLRKKEAQPKFVAAFADPATRLEAMQALAQMQDPALLDTLLAGLAAERPIADAAQRGIDQMKDKALALLEARQQAQPFPPPVLARLQTIYRQHAQAREGPLLAGTAAPPDPKDHDQFARKTPGDPANGRAAFLATGCAACHRAEGQGGEIGPDLTGLAAKYGREQIIESVLYPSKVLLDGYQQTILTMNGGEKLAGMVRASTGTELKLADAAGQTRTIARADIASQEKGKNSIMPDGLHLALTPESFADLIAYLESLTEKPTAPSTTK